MFRRKKFNRNSRLVVIVAFLFVQHLFIADLYGQAQKIIDSVAWFDKGDADVVHKNGQITGYAFTCQLPKPSKHEYVTVTNLYDSNLNNNGKIILHTDDKEVLMEHLYLYDQLICIFFNNKSHSVITRVYNNSGNVVKEYSRVLDDNSEYYFKKHPSGGSTTGQKNEYVFAFDDHSFFTIIPLKYKAVFSYELSIYKQGQNPLIYTPHEDTKQERPEFIGIADNLLLFHVMSKKVLVNNKYESWLLGIDFTNGTKRFMISTLSGKYPYYPTNMALLAGRNDFTILGSYFRADSKIQKTRTSGICTIHFNNRGEELARAYQSWEEDIGKYLTIVDTGGINDFGNLYVQNIIPVNNDYVVVGEGYKKSGNEGAAALNILSLVAGAATGIMMNGISVYPLWGYDYTNFTLTDLAIFKMDSSFKIYDVHTFSKETHKTLTYGNDVINKTKIEARRYLSQSFDYDYIQPENDSISFIVGYRYYSKVKKKDIFDYRIIESKTGQYLVHNIPLSSSADAVWGMPAKPNCTLIGEYFAKEQKVKLSLIKIE